jgi:uncharacterized protein YabN with tetrapyrrole methylase and pyrophosphatase domain
MTINRGGTKKIIKPHEYIAKENQRCKIQKQQKKWDNLKRNGKKTKEIKKILPPIGNDCQQFCTSLI